MIIGKKILQMIITYYYKDKRRLSSPFLIVMFRGTPCMFSHLKAISLYILEDIFTNAKQMA